MKRRLAELRNYGEIPTAEFLYLYSIASHLSNICLALALPLVYSDT